MTAALPQIPYPDVTQLTGAALSRLRTGVFAPGTTSAQVSRRHLAPCRSPWLGNRNSASSLMSTAISTGRLVMSEEVLCGLARKLSKLVYPE